MVDSIAAATKPICLVEEILFVGIMVIVAAVGICYSGTRLQLHAEGSDQVNDLGNRIKLLAHRAAGEVADVTFWPLSIAGIN